MAPTRRGATTVPVLLAAILTAAALPAAPAPAGHTRELMRETVVTEEGARRLPRERPGKP